MMFRDQFGERVDDVQTPSVIFVNFLEKPKVTAESFKCFTGLTFSANNFKQLVSESACSDKLVSFSLMEVSNRLDILLSFSSSLFCEIIIQLTTHTDYRENSPMLRFH